MKSTLSLTSACLAITSSAFCTLKIVADLDATKSEQAHFDGTAMRTNLQTGEYDFATHSVSFTIDKNEFK
jgi:hypothetical protein